MTTLSVSKIEQYAYNAGFRGAALAMATAVAEAESGGNPNAYNPETAAGTASGAGSRGLWQIYGAAHPAYNNSAVFDPQANANAAYAIYQAAGNTFNPWSTYKNGAAQRIEQSLGITPIASAAPVSSLPTTGSSSVDPASALSGALSSLVGAAIPGATSTGSSSSSNPLASLIPADLGSTIAIGAVGVVLLIFGFIIFARSV